MTGDSSFWTSASTREARCTNKDRIIVPVLESIEIRRPDRYKALLMPCLHSPELKILSKKLVPPTSIFAIEKNPKVHVLMKERLGIRVTPKAMDAGEGIDHIEADNPSGFDIVYLDFFGQPGLSHLEIIEKIFYFRMLRPGAKLILTFGKTRTRSRTKQINDMLSTGQPLPTSRYLQFGIEKTRHRKPGRVTEQSYRSLGHEFLTTIADF